LNAKRALLDEVADALLKKESLDEKEFKNLIEKERFEPLLAKTNL
jgi:ATP-dependent Zn protease